MMKGKNKIICLLLLLLLAAVILLNRKSLEKVIVNQITKNMRWTLWS